MAPLQILGSKSDLNLPHIQTDLLFGSAPPPLPGPKNYKNVVPIK